MKNLILKYGVIAGLIVGLHLLSVFLLFGHDFPMDWGMVIGYTAMLVAFSMIFVATKRHRDQNLGGVIGFWPAFAMGLCITGIATLFYVLSWEIVMASSNLDFMAFYGQAMLEQEKAKGASAEALAKMAQEMNEFAVMYAKPWYRMLITATEILPVGLLVTLISALLVRRPGFMPAKAQVA